MPRVTRAALRSQELQDESTLAASTPLPLTPAKGRVPLGEISDNLSGKSNALSASEEKIKLAKKAPAKGKLKREKATKKATMQEEKASGEQSVGILEDGNRSATSAAVEEACKDLMNVNFRDACNSSFQDERSQTPPSAAVTTAVQQILPEAPSPLLDNGTPGPNDTSIKSQKHEKDDSWVENVKSCTPAETTSGEGNSVREVILVNHDQCNDSFVEQIETRTPGKRISRIEDSVEALDALEEEIEKVGESLPTASNKVRSLIKAEKHAKGPKKATDTNVHGSVRIKKALGCLIDTTKEKSNTNARSSVSKAPFQSSIKKTTSLRSSVAHVKPAATLEGSVTQTIPDEKKTALKKRVSSVHKAPFQPSKSAKPPTRAAFELPGEALSRKLKGQREDRLKREEEEKTKKRVFKARPVRISQAPEVKLTAATKARLSLAKAGTSNDMNPIQDATDDKMNVSARSTAPNVANKRFSTLSVAKRTSQGLTHAPRKPSTNSAVAPVRRPSTTPRAPSAMDTSPPIPSTEDLAYQRSKGKEVFARTRIEIMEREKARKEKEEAARKARADAAERGRVASREWAEKQKKKKLEVAKGDKEGKSVVA